MLLREDPVPPLVTEAAKAALGWRRLDADLAELLADSSLEAGSPALTRGAGAALRSVNFSAGALSIDVEIHGGSADSVVLGQLSPPTCATIEVQTADQAAPAVIESDDLGRFRTKLPPANAFRLRVAIGDSAGPKWIETSWIPL